MRQIILDTETTGLDPAQGHRLVEVAGVEIINRRLTGKHLHLYVNPDRDSDPEALEIHGLSTEFLSGHPRFPEVMQELLDFVNDAEVIIHNASFDIRFLDSELKLAGNARGFDQYCAKITDSLAYARELHPGKRNSLDALCERYSISNAHRVLHGALLDSELLADVWLAMTQGQDALIMDFASEQESEGFIELEGSDNSLLRVIHASQSELAEHEKYLKTLDKSCTTGAVWHRLA